MQRTKGHTLVAHGKASAVFSVAQEWDGRALVIDAEDGVTEVWIPNEHIDWPYYRAKDEYRPRWKNVTREGSSNKRSLLEALTSGGDR